MGDHMTRGEYDRLFTALVTPFKQGSYDVDESATRDLVEYYTENETFDSLGGGFIVNPEAGEVFYLDREERQRNVELVAEEASDEYPVFAGVFGVSREEIRTTAQDALEAGADGLFVMPPAGTMEVTTTLDARNNPEVWQNHVETVADVADVPVLVHPTAPMSHEYGEGLPLESTKAVVESEPNVVGWKMTYNFRGYEKIASYLRSLDRHVAVLGAEGSHFHAAQATGTFDGTVTGAWNFAMEPMLEHVSAWRENDVERARRIWHERLSDLFGYVYETFSRLHIRYKLATWLRGLTSHPFMRPPMPAPNEDEVDELDRLLRDAGLETIDEDRQEETKRTIAAGGI
ncbi:dihydrodipicolinate synthase family protein [Natrarchaeobius halalkaliphilus]|uniref:Dihydrodipicolinate synthase family protein n=2 Tax=Natrarchaeobius halalkaliphilus TaxID=1679091 RepID=A0A3N6LYU5_9EURY|nr:dihydrodipicolinate synthase family protein [Natrarchaeobius halalkaliphilus]